MKTFLPLDTMALHCDTGSRHDFPRLARESGFSFNLFPGRVDWTKIGAVDVDKLVRERDLETLQDTLSNIMSCSLDGEYDLKVLDPNFVKLFRLAQLATDFLLYCRNYLDHCVTVMQEQLRFALQEIEDTQKLLQHKTEEVSSLQRKLKSKSKSFNMVNTVPVSKFKCSICKKLFVGEQYLLEHQERRHPALSITDSLAATKNKEIDFLHQQVQQLQDRLHATEEALKFNKSSVVPDVVALQALLQHEIQKMKPKVENSLSPEFAPSSVDSENICGKAMAPLQPIISSQTAETEKEKHASMAQSGEQLKAEHEADQAALLVRIEQLNDEIKALRDQLQEQHQSHEIVMQKKLEDLQHQHRADLDDLCLSITRSRGTGGHKMDAVANKVTVVEDTPQFSLTQACEKLSDTESSVIKAPCEGTTVTPVKKNNDPLASQSSESTTRIPALIEAKQSKEREETAVLEEYESSSDHELSESSSHTSSNAITPHQSDATKEAEKTGGSIQSLLLGVDNSNSKSMYGRSSSSSNATESESGTSSFDSDSQSSNSEQQPSCVVNDSDKLRLQLTPQVLSGLKEDLLGLLNQRLRELGVDPEWERLPVDSFHSNMATVKHHENITAKSQNQYFEVQEAIMREVDKRVADCIKQQQKTSRFSGPKKKQTIGSFSIFARLKSHVKNKLSHSAHSPSSLSKQSPKTAVKVNSGGFTENEYSQNPSTSKLSHDYETLQEKSTPSASISDKSDPYRGSNVENYNLFDGSVLATKLDTTDVVYENVGDKLKPLTTGTDNTVKVFSRSMYANLNRSEIEVEKKSWPSHSSLKGTISLPTSTPMKSGVQPPSQVGGEKTGKQPFISSDAESISELESDLNDMMENTSSKPGTLLQTKPHTTRTTAELIASVAKLRQNTGQVNATQTIVKSNLKSSLSTGNIMKKKVVFRDEKDGFDTIEVGPAHSSYESITPQRSHSESSLALSFSSSQSSDRPLPQPRSSLMAPTDPVISVNMDNTDSDWDWDRDSSENTILKEIEGRSSSNIECSGHNIGNIKDSSWNSSTIKDKQEDESSADVSRVSDIVRDIEKKMQKEKPPFGINITGCYQASVPTSSSLSGVSQVSAGSGLSPRINNSAKLPHEGFHDSLSDLLLDDFSSS